MKKLPCPDVIIAQFEDNFGYVDDGVWRARYKNTEVWLYRTDDGKYVLEIYEDMPSSLIGENVNRVGALIWNGCDWEVYRVYKDIEDDELIEIAAQVC